MADEDRWKEDILKLADNFAEESRDLEDFAHSLRKAIEVTDQDTCLALVVAFLERLIERRTDDGRIHASRSRQ